MKLEIRESLNNSILIVIMIIFLAGYGFFEINDFIEMLGITIYSIIMTAIIIYLVYQIIILFQRRLIMSIDDTGIYHKDFNLKTWDSILSVKRTRKNMGEYENVFFLIQTTDSAQPYKVKISNLEISENEIVRAIHNFRDYNIYEVTYDEW